MGFWGSSLLLVKRLLTWTFEIEGRHTYNPFAKRYAYDPFALLLCYSSLLSFFIFYFHPSTIYLIRDTFIARLEAKIGRICFWLLCQTLFLMTLEQGCRHNQLLYVLLFCIPLCQTSLAKKSIHLGHQSYIKVSK